MNDEERSLFIITQLQNQLIEYMGIDEYRKFFSKVLSKLAVEEIMKSKLRTEELGEMMPIKYEIEKDGEAYKFNRRFETEDGWRKEISDATRNSD